MVAILEWNVYVEDFNRREIKVYNIFKHDNFLKDCRKLAKTCMDKTTFAENIRKNLLYYYWSKCEWEIILSDWPTSNKFKNEKVSVFDQIMINWDRFIDYLWENRSELKKNRVKYDA